MGWGVGTAPPVVTFLPPSTLWVVHQRTRSGRWGSLFYSSPCESRVRPVSSENTLRHQGRRAGATAPRGAAPGRFPQTAQEGYWGAGVGGGGSLQERRRAAKRGAAVPSREKQPTIWPPGALDPP